MLYVRLIVWWTPLWHLPIGEALHALPQVHSLHKSTIGSCLRRTPTIQVDDLFPLPSCSKIPSREDSSQQRDQSSCIRSISSLMNAQVSSPPHFPLTIDYSRGLLCLSEAQTKEPLIDVLATNHHQGFSLMVPRLIPHKNTPCTTRRCNPPAQGFSSKSPLPRVRFTIQDSACIGVREVNSACTLSLFRIPSRWTVHSRSEKCTNQRPVSLIWFHAKNGGNARKGEGS